MSLEKFYKENLGRVQEHLRYSARRCARLEAAIRRVLADDESQPGGWGPDVTTVEFLREALRED